MCHSRPMHVPATYTPPRERAACRFAFALVPTHDQGIGFPWTVAFRRLVGWFTSVLLRASYLTGISPAFSSTVHYPSLENRAAGGGSVAAPVARHRGVTPSFRDPSSTVHLLLAHYPAGFTLIIWASVCDATLPALRPHIGFLFVSSVALLRRFLHPNLAVFDLRFATLGDEDLWSDFH